MAELGVVHSTALPMREISALAVRAGKSGSELLAVGDEDFAVVCAELDDGGRPAETSRHDLHRVLRDEIPGDESGSGFEGIATDGEGNVIVLQEEVSRLLVLSPGVDRLLGIVTLTVPEDTPVIGAKWHGDPNKRAEGLLLLDGGHVLVAKQLDPACLIELGPAGDDPVGVGKDTLAKPEAAFAHAGGGELVALEVWSLGEDTAKALPSLNDLAADDDGRLYAVSSEACAIARFEKRLEPGERARADATWRLVGLPGGKKTKPEGLAFVADGQPAVGIDSKLAGDNVMLVDVPS